jgi:copper resistance protein B
MSAAGVEKTTTRIDGRGRLVAAALVLSMACAASTAAEENMKGMGHDAGPPRMQGGSAPPDARDPHAYSDGYDFGPLARPRMGDEHSFGSLLVDRLESAHSSSNTSAAYDIKAWYGRDYDRAVLKAEGDYDGGDIEEARTELLWGHAVAPYWDRQLGVRHDSGIGPERDWIAFGFQGLAPYWFEVDAAAYLGEGGRTALRIEAEYELLLTQKLVLQPRIEANMYSKRDAERGLGSGLSDLTAGVRLRYEIRREFAPYIVIERAVRFGATADLAQAAGSDPKETRLVAGLRFWF